MADSQGLEYGDSAVRNTWQGKVGFVLNPSGLGIYARPSIRLLYGVQWSSQQAAFGNGFVDSLSQYNNFPSNEIHWHHLISLESEGWFCRRTIRSHSNSETASPWTASSRSWRCTAMAGIGRC